MRQKADGGLRAVMHQNLKSFGHCQAIETGMIAAGVPDTNICFKDDANCSGVETWIECKRADAWAVKVRGPQVGWSEQRVRNGGRVFCAVRRIGSVKTGAYDELWLLRHQALRMFISGVTLATVPAPLLLGRWHGGPQHWDWRSVARLLRTAEIVPD